MKRYIFLAVFFISSISIAQNQRENKEIKVKVEITTEQQKEEESKKIKSLAEQRTITLQKELNLNSYASSKIKKAIIKYSIKANKIIQSNISANEKTKTLSNLVYFQNEEFKEFLTVHQFYQYIKMYQ